MNARITIVLLSCAMIALGGRALAHGVTGAMRIGNAVQAEIRYDDGEPFSYSEVKVYGPGEGKTEYQNGRTDAKGVFAFVPDRKGTWRLVATDGMSHGKELSIDITDAALMKKSDAWDSARRQKLFSGLFLIWAVVATSLYVGARRRKKGEA